MPSAKRERRAAFRLFTQITRAEAAKIKIHTRALARPRERRQLAVGNRRSVARHAHFARFISARALCGDRVSQCNIPFATVGGDARQATAAAATGVVAKTRSAAVAAASPRDIWPFGVCASRERAAARHALKAAHVATMATTANTNNLGAVRLCAWPTPTKSDNSGA